MGFFFPSRLVYLNRRGQFILWVPKHGGKALPFSFFSCWLVSDGANGIRPPNQFIAPVSEPYGYIIFRASEVKDLSVDEPPPAQSQHNVHDDPAVLGVRSVFFSFLVM